MPIPDVFIAVSYGDKFVNQLLNKAKFVLFLSIYSLTTIVIYKLTEASFLQLQPPYS
jgi:hypothetical protein